MFTFTMEDVGLAAAAVNPLLDIAGNTHFPSVHFLPTAGSSLADHRPEQFRVHPHRSRLLSPANNIRNRYFCSPHHRRHLRRHREHAPNRNLSIVLHATETEPTLASSKSMASAAS